MVVVTMRAWVLLLTMATMVPLPGPPQKDRLSTEKSELERKDDPVERAKLLARIGPEEFDEIDRDAAAKNVDRTLEQLREYRDEVVQTHQALQAAGIDASRKPAGFRQLEISLRENVRRLDDLAYSFPLEEREPFEKIREELKKVHQDLLNRLFSAPAHEEKPKLAAPGKPKGGRYVP
jgi:hypothetical protein